MFNVAIADPQGEVLGVVVLTDEAKNTVIPALMEGKKGHTMASFKMVDGVKTFSHFVLFIEP